MKFSIFAKYNQTTRGHEITAQQAFARIKNNIKQKDLIQKIRETKDKDERDKLKLQLPLYCFSGLFSHRNDKSCIEHSGLICLDFDNEILDNILAKKEFIYACFLSPSGNGYKVLIKIPASTEDHEDYFWALQEHFNLQTLDIKSRNLSRACFDTQDENIYINEQSPVFIQKLPSKSIEISPGVKYEGPLKLENEERIIKILQKWIDKNNDFKKGRNNYIHLLACSFNRYGIFESTATQYCLQFQEKGFDANEIQKAVRSAYKSNTHEHNTQYFIDTEPVHLVRDLKQKNVSLANIKAKLQEVYQYPSSKVDNIIQEADKASNNDIFWTYQTKRDGSTIISIDFSQLIKFFTRKGIYRYKTDTNSWMMVFIKNKIVEEINADMIRDIIRIHFEEKLPQEIDGIDKNKILQQLQNQFDSTYLTEEKLAWIPNHEIVWQRDEKDTAYFYFKNCAVKVTKSKVESIDYATQLEGSIWKDQIIQREFTLNIEENKSIFSNFIWCITTADDKSAQHNYAIMCNTIGYILHSYKDPANPKAIILTDEVISENPEGGIGKGIFIKALGHMKNLVTFDGKNWNWNKSFIFQRVTLATQILAFEDVGKNYSFERLFSIITEGIEVEKKNKESFYIPYQHSPKVLITSNYVIEGKGASHDRRRHEIELKQFFSPKYTPKDHYGHNLYNDWDNNEWNRFDNFMMLCTQSYLFHGLLEPKTKNLLYKKLLHEVPDDFIQYVTPIIEKEDIINCKEICDEYRASNSDFSKTLNRTIINWIKKVLDFNQIKHEMFRQCSISYIKLLKFTDRSTDLQIDTDEK